MSKIFTRPVVITLVIIGAITLGFIAYLIAAKIEADNKPKTPSTYVGDEISLSDENVQILYQYVTYGAEGVRNTKFVNNREVNINSFNNQEKLYYALMFAQVEDFEFTGELDSNKKKIYNIPDSKILGYMKLFFGPSVTYQPEAKFNYPFTFYINNMNVGTMTHNSERGGYDTIFASNQDISKKGIEPVYGQLISALRKPDGKVVLQERVVYTELRTDNGSYAVDVFKDPEKTNKLGSVGVSEDQLKDTVINLSNYASTAIVEYTFGLNGQQLYFESSRIII